MPIKAKWVPFEENVIEALALREAGVYEIGKARGNAVLYIGKSDKSIRQRLLEHKGKTAFAECTHFRKRKTQPANAASAETKLLSEYKKRHGRYPKLNKNKPPREDSVFKFLFG